MHNLILLLKGFNDWLSAFSAKISSQKVQISAIRMSAQVVAPSWPLGRRTTGFLRWLYLTVPLWHSKAYRHNITMTYVMFNSGGRFLRFYWFPFLIVTLSIGWFPCGSEECLRSACRQMQWCSLAAGELNNGESTASLWIPLDCSEIALGNPWESMRILSEHVEPSCARYNSAVTACSSAWERVAKLLSSTWAAYRNLGTRNSAWLKKPDQD